MKQNRVPTSNGIRCPHRPEYAEKATEKQAGLHFLLSNHCVSKAHLHTLKHDELRMLITFQVLVAPCPDKKFRSVCTAQAGLSRPSVRS